MNACAIAWFQRVVLLRNLPKELKDSRMLIKLKKFAAEEVRKLRVLTDKNMKIAMNTYAILLEASFLKVHPRPN